MERVSWLMRQLFLSRNIKLHIHNVSTKSSLGAMVMRSAPDSANRICGCSNRRVVFGVCLLCFSKCNSKIINKTMRTGFPFAFTHTPSSMFLTHTHITLWLVIMVEKLTLFWVCGVFFSEFHQKARKRGFDWSSFNGHVSLAATLYWVGGPDVVLLSSRLPKDSRLSRIPHNHH